MSIKKRFCSLFKREIKQGEVKISQVHFFFSGPNGLQVENSNLPNRLEESSVNHDMLKELPYHTDIACIIFPLSTFSCKFQGLHTIINRRYDPKRKPLVLAEFLCPSLPPIFSSLQVHQDQKISHLIEHESNQYSKEIDIIITYSSQWGWISAASK